MKRALPQPPATSTLLAEAARYYAERFRLHGDSARGMDWRDAASQRLRFARLLACIEPGRRVSVLDVGCGNGELLAYCRERGLAIDYRGVDICTEMVAACERRFGVGVAALGGTEDLERQGWQADYVLTSGIFNVRQQTPEATWRSYVQRAIAQLFAACRVAAVFNVLTTLADYRRDDLFYLDPRSIPDLAAACGTRFFGVDASYPLHEMTVSLWRSVGEGR